MGRFRRYALLVAVLGLNALAWTVSLALGPTGLPLRRVAAEFFSSSAVVLMSANIVLATRPFVLDRLYGGLDKLFVSHRANGVAVALAVASHFSLMPESPGLSPVKLLAYTNITLVLVSVGLAIAPRSPWRKFVPLSYHHWKLEHRFMGIFLSFAVLHSLVVHPIMLSLPIERTWLYGMATLGLLSYVYREFAERFVKERHLYRVAETRRVGDDVLEIALAPAERPIAHRAGQFAFVRFDGGPSREQHPFTLSAAPQPSEALRLSVKASGDWTAALQEHLTVGSAARIEGAYGGFDFHRGGQRQLWLAGGIGITPFLAFLGDAELDCDVRLIWSVPMQIEAAGYLPEIQRSLAEHPNIAFELWVSGTQGRLRLDALGLERPDELSAFVCGPVPMRDAFVVQLGVLGVARRETYYEEFSLR